MTPSVWGRIVGEHVPHTRFHLWFDLHAALWMAVVAACVVGGGTGGTGLMSRAVSVRPLRALGWVSYSVYLFHGMVLAYAEEWLVGRVPHWAVGGAVLAVCIAVGTVSFLLVERPFLELLRGERPSLPCEAPVTSRGDGR